jgi:hypothetical protein
MLYRFSLPKLLLVLEWILLGIAAFLTSVVEMLGIFPQSSILTIVCIGIITTLGFKPVKRFHPIGYTLIELGLIWLPVLVGKSIVTFPILGAVLVLRSAQRFDLLGRLGVGGVSMLCLL